MDNNKNLLDEIDKLEDNEEVSEDAVIASREKAFTLVIVIIIIAALVMLYLAYKGNYIASNDDKGQDYYATFGDSNNEYNVENETIDSDEEEIDYFAVLEQREKKFEEQKTKISFTSQNRDVNGDLVVTLNNGNEEALSNVRVQVIFYDGENKPMKIEESTAYFIEPNQNYYLTFIKTPSNYERCDFVLSQTSSLEYISHKDDITYDVKENNDTIEISGKNTSGEKLTEIAFFVVYYNENDQIIAVKELYDYDVKKNKTFNMRAYKTLYSNELCEEVPYNRYEVVYSGAYSMNDN